MDEIPRAAVIAQLRRCCGGLFVVPGVDKNEIFLLAAMSFLRARVLMLLRSFRDVMRQIKCE